MMTMMNTLLRALTRALAELIESESGEFLSTREKSCLLHAMMQQQQELDGASGAVPPAPSSYFDITHSPT
jgi:hypothetical protein